MPPHSFLLGHLGLVAEITRAWPRDFHGHYLALEIRRRFPLLPPIFYLDLWPTGPPLVVITSASGACRIAQHEPQLLKHGGVLGFLQPLIGKHGLVTMEGDEWKYWRGIFNPGFNAANLSTQVPGIVENTMVLYEILEERAAGREVFSLFETMSRLTMDMSCLATLGSRLNAQRGGCDLVAAFRSQASWIPSPNEQNLFRKLNPLRPLVYRYNRWRMDRYVSLELDSRFAVQVQGRSSEQGQPRRGKAVVDLALETYLLEQRVSVSRDPEEKDISPHIDSDASRATPLIMDARFKQYAISQMKLFLFAGYDTTASAAVYAIHLLSLNPQCLQRAREEHDAVLGTGVIRAETAARISQQPHLLNRLAYTSAVIREALRLYPPVSSTRESAADFTLLDEASGQMLETEGFMLWGVHQSIQRDPEHWPEPNRFIPDRWLVPAGHALYPRDKEAWRPFERGPRNCIGQELALLEVRVILAMVLRDFDFCDAYAEFRARKGWSGPTEVQGDRAYQVLLGSSKPNNGYPCKVARRTGVK
ncbi:cytochrome P450 71B25 [Hypoxylon argillaceum]|nr:cytochrome P450 71B25 [Hypoxylon argillaceum]